MHKSRKHENASNHFHMCRVWKQQVMEHLAQNVVKHLILENHEMLNANN